MRLTCIRTPQAQKNILIVCFGGPAGNRTRSVRFTGRLALELLFASLVVDDGYDPSTYPYEGYVIASSPIHQSLAGPHGFEPRPAVFRCILLRKHRGDRCAAANTMGLLITTTRLVEHSQDNSTINIFIRRLYYDH